MRTRRIVLFVLLLTGVTPALSLAQSLSPEAVARINAATKAEVRLRIGTRVTLFGPRADSASLAFARGDSLDQVGRLAPLTPPLPVARVAEIRVPGKTHAGRGAKIGGGIGAGIALLAVVGTSGDPTVSPSGSEAFAAIAVWTLLGAGIGALIGHGSHGSETVYSALIP